MPNTLLFSLGTAAWKHAAVLLECARVRYMEDACVSNARFQCSSWVWFVRSYLRGVMVMAPAKSS